MRISLKEAIRFHGHLGPYLILGILAGEAALKILKCKKYFGLEAKVWGATKRPKSCLIDGLQLSTGATFGKGNIEKTPAPSIKIQITNCQNKQKIIFKLKEQLVKKIETLKAHKDSELFAKQLYKTNYSYLFHSKLYPKPKT
ncbi:MAG: formylmethanofuran dehydrogenase subunit E family protein [Candidatus Omnitrophica bacterium]|nr:formylmethanofuran dehydrogenase subunit E family protein [Candidatus Omnitrophota bacterium]